MNEENQIIEGYLVTNEMKKVRSIQLDLLTKLLEVCKKYNLQIWADSGTLLGTIRHKGYIPWDDDIDMVMLRQDYDKLIEISSKEFKNPYFMQTGYSEKSCYPRGHAQLRHSDTAAILPIDIDQSFNQGIFIDIFVLDNIPTTIGELNKYLIKVNSWRFVLKFKAGYIKYGFNIKHIIKCSFALILSLCLSNRKLYYYFDKSLKKYKNNSSQFISYVGLSSSLEYIQSRFINKAWFEETEYGIFEGIEIPIPTGYENLLSLLYGDDYMKPVKLPTAHGKVIFNTEQSYTSVLLSLRKNK